MKRFIGLVLWAMFAVGLRGAVDPFPLPLPLPPTTNIFAALDVVNTFTVSQQFTGPLQAYIDSGTANAYAITIGTLHGTTFSYQDGQRFWVKVAHANTGASTLNINATGAHAIHSNASALIGGELLANLYYEFGYNSTSGAFDLIGTSLAPTPTIRRTCMAVLGADNAAAGLSNADISPQKGICFVPSAVTVQEITIEADGGTPSVTVSKNHAGTQTALLSSSLATGSSGAIACSNTGGTTGIDGVTTCSATLQNTSLAAGDWIDLTAGVAGGTAKRFSIAVTWQ